MNPKFYKKLKDEDEKLYVLEKRKPFPVENGSGQDVLYDGTYVNIDILKPKSKSFHTVKAFIMPHDNLPCDMILGTKDAASLGYVSALKLGKHEIIFEHKGKINHMKELGDSALADGPNYFGGHKVDIGKQQIYQNVHFPTSLAKGTKEKLTHLYKAQDGYYRGCIQLSVDGDRTKIQFPQNGKIKTVPTRLLCKYNQQLLNEPHESGKESKDPHYWDYINDQDDEQEHNYYNTSSRETPKLSWQHDGLPERL